MKKVLMIMNAHGGLYLFRKEIIQELLGRGFMITVALPYGENVEKITRMGCDFIDISIKRHGKNPMGDIGLFIRCYKAIKRMNPDMVLTFNIKPNIYGNIACRLQKTPCISNITGIGVMQQGGQLQKLLLFMQRVAFKKSVCVFFQNEANFALYRSKKVVINQGRLVPGSGVNLENFVEAKYPSVERAVRFLTIARLDAEKGYDVLFAAVRAMKGARVEFHVIGPSEDDAYLGQLEALKEEYSVIYHGSLTQEEVRDHIAACHCLIHPTQYGEGMANVILESAATARPVIATDIPGCREAVDDGVSGYLFPRGDAAALTDRIRHFISMPWDEKREMGLAGRRKMEREFDRRVVVDAYMEEIEKVAAGDYYENDVPKIIQQKGGASPLA